MMKKILITGAGSYIGTSLEAYLKQWPDDYQVDTVDMIDGTWRERSFAGYDAIYHVAALVHMENKNLTDEEKQRYYSVNVDLVAEVAAKAKSEGVSQFIFMSSMSVYGMETGVITRETVPAPNTIYGKSKLKAEKQIEALADDSFTVCILRPPMIYGKDCKGNFQKILKLVKKLPVFPKLSNERSLIHIDNFVSFVRMCVDRRLGGLFFPQNRQYVTTIDLAENMALALGKKLRFSRILGFGVRLIRPFVSVAKKAFGSLVYQDMEDFDFSYVVVENSDSIQRSV